MATSRTPVCIDAEAPLSDATRQTGFEEPSHDRQFEKLGATMVTVFSGPFEALSPPEREAVRALTTERYVDEIIQLDQEIVRGGVERWQTSFEPERRTRYQRIEVALRQLEQHTCIAAILARNGPDTVALAALRTVRGSRAIAVSESIGDPDSSLPTHRLLTGFTYPSTPDFKPNITKEWSIHECCRLAIVAKPKLKRLAECGFLTADQSRYISAHACQELILASYLRDLDGEPFTAYIFSVQPRLAHVLLARFGIPLIPMFGSRTAPSAHALEPDGLFTPYFSRWNTELQRADPTLMQSHGSTAVLADLAVHSLSRSYPCSLSLPFLLPVGDRLKMAITALQADVTPIRDGRFLSTREMCEYAMQP